MPWKDPAKRRAKMQRWRAANAEHVRAYREAWSKAHPKPAPIKLAAHSAVTHAIKMGRLVRGPCVICGEPKTHGHHEDYSKPLEVVWLCAVHHGLLHRSK